ncbi:MAG: YihY family inner membrane protein [Gammaproteobacteria bacterium]|nr:YihY family inner membrane protein [Gammaproteobacteria bacterium]
MHSMIGNFSNQLDNLVWGGALQKYGLPGRILTAVLRNLYAVLRDMFAGQLTLRAMSLVYTTLLSVVPLIAFSFAVLKGFGVHELLEDKMYLLLEPLGEKGREITDNVMRLVKNVNGGLLGGVSLAFFIYTAISMVQKVEEAFNYAWYVSKPRSFARRFTEYVFVLTIGPVVIVLALGMIGSLQDEGLVKYLLENQLVGPLFVATSKVTPFLLVTGTFAFLYWFMPNTKVRLGSALVGGVAGGFLWATLGVIVATFIVNSARTMSVYGGFAIAIIALIWLYLNWLVLLVGAQLAFYHQNPAYLRIGRREPRLSSSTRERLALNIMLLIGQAFRDSRATVTIADISDKLRIPSITLEPIMAGLEENGLLTSTEAEELVPGRDTALIALGDILAVVREFGETGSISEPRWSPAIENIGTRLDKAVASTVDHTTLAELLDQARN